MLLLLTPVLLYLFGVVFLLLLELGPPFDPEPVEVTEVMLLLLAPSLPPPLPERYLARPEKLALRLGGTGTLMMGDCCGGPGRITDSFFFYYFCGEWRHAKQQA